MSKVLEQAQKIITGPRAREYGDARESFSRIAWLWSGYLNHFISPADVAAMMTLLKLTRMKYSDYMDEDSFVDACGYIALADYIAAPQRDTAAKQEAAAEGLQ